MVRRWRSGGVVDQAPVRRPPGYPSVYEAAEMIEQLKTYDFDNEPDSSPINLVNVSGAMADAA
jgi:hypothetical protein